MKLIITAQVQGFLESYKIFVDDELIAKVRGNYKKTTVEVSDEEHTIQLKGLNGKSSIIKLKPEKVKESITLTFITRISKVSKEGYFELVGEE